MEAIQCEAYLAAVELGSMTAAAERLDYTQSGITRLIGSLEAELGFSLLSRGKRGVQPTENGLLMMPLFRELTNAHRKIEQLGTDINGSVRGTLTIGSYYSVSAMWLPALISEFRTLYPGVKISLQEGGNLELARRLEERSVDLCFCAEPRKGLCDWIPLFLDEIVAWLPEGHPCAGAASFPVGRLAVEPFIHTQPNEDTELDRLLDMLGIRPDTCFTTRDAYTTYNMVEAGLGISCNQRLISKKWKGRVAEIPFDPPQFVTLGIAIPSLKETSPAAKRFLALAQEKK